jgi:hypothetical protein
MKRSQILLAVLFLLVINILPSCKKKGCTDRDADNFDENAEKSDGSCQCRYASSVRIDAIPSTDGSGSAWDTFSAPDLFVRFSKSSSSTWDYVTNTVSDASFPTSLILPSGDVKFTNENWQFQIVDYDSPDPNDVIYSGTFNPLTNGGTGNVVIAGTGVSITFVYSVK